MASIAILADDAPAWRPTSVTTGLWGSTTSCTFTMVKLLDYAVREQEFLESRNAFALAVVAHLRARASRKQWPLRLRFKVELAAVLGDKGFPPERVRLILGFVDWILLLPRSWETRYTEEVRQFEERKRMPYVMSFERFAMEKGLEKGRQEGREEGRQEGRQQGHQEGALGVLLRLVTRRFGGIPQELEASLLVLRAEQLEELADMLFELGSVDELKAWVEARAPRQQ